MPQTDLQAGPARRFWFGALALLLLFAAGGADRPLPPRPHACRFWALVGADYPQELLRDHLETGVEANLRTLGGLNRDGWGFASFPGAATELPLIGPIIRRGGPPANHPTDPDYALAVEEIGRLRPKAVIGHVRLGSSGHWGIPDPHPFQHEGMVFAHNGGLPVQTLTDLLTGDDPRYLELHPPDYVNGYIDSELYFLCLLKFIHQTPRLARPEALRRAVHRVAQAAPDCRLNFVLTSGDTLYALRHSPGDDWDPVRYYPAAGPSGPEGVASPYYVVASEVLGSSPSGWGTIPPEHLAVFVPGQRPLFLAVADTSGGPTEEAADGVPDPVGRARPNPLRGALTIPVAVPVAGAQVSIEIWDVQGRLIWQTEPAWLAAGQKELHWEGLDLGGRPVPSGSYFCRVFLAGRDWEQRITLVR